MKTVAKVVLAVWCALSLSGLVWAEVHPSGQAIGVSEHPKHLWDLTKASLKQGNYREALQTLEVILTVTPNDPWAQVYHSLCEVRLQSPSRFAQLSLTQLDTLKAQLRQEEHAQRKAAAQQKALEAQSRKEQARWDQELKLLQQQFEREQTAKRKQAQAEAVEHARAKRAQERALAQQQAIRQAQLPQPQAATSQPGLNQAPPPIVATRGQQPQSELTTPTTSAPAQATTPEVGTRESVPSATQPVSSAAQGPALEVSPATSLMSPATSAAQKLIELSPIVVPTTPAPGAPEGALSPSLAERPKPPPGAVQINARQMSVSPERKIALAEGNVEVLYEETFLTCDRLTLFTDTKDVYAEGHVRLEEGTQVFRGDMVHYNFESKKGRFLQGTVSAPPWYEYGRSVEHIAEGVYQVTPGYLTSCEFEPPHFKFFGQRTTVFADDRYAHTRGGALMVDRVPMLYLPWFSFSERQSPFYIIPGKKKPWGHFVLMGYRYELPELPGGGSQTGTVKLDWRRFFGWGQGLDHQIKSRQLGKGILKLYYNEEPNMAKKKEELPKMAGRDRYRMLWRHSWQPLPDTNVVTDFQKFSDVDFRKEFLFREEFVNDDIPESFISVVQNTDQYSLSGLFKKRVNRFQSVTEALPELTFDVRSQRIGDSQLFSETHFDAAEFRTFSANTHFSNRSKAFRVDWFQQLRYALALFQPIGVTPRVGVRQTLYSKDQLRSDGVFHRDVFSGQFSLGADASLKLFRVFPITTNAFGLNIHWLRHVLTPTLSYTYTHLPTVPNGNLNFAAAADPTNQLSFGLENKLQTKRPVGKERFQNVDLARFLISVPYTFRGTTNKQGGRLGDWPFKLELYPWRWLRMESDWTYPSHFMKGSRDERIQAWNLDLVMVGGMGTPLAQHAPKIQPPLAPEIERRFQSTNPDIQAPGPLEAVQIGPRGKLTALMMPQGQWYLGLGHRYSYNDKTESVLQFDWRPCAKWEISTFHRFDWKQVAGGAKRFNNLREFQYALRRDLHDWIGELVYRVDREFGEELWFTMTLKAYSGLSFGLADSYHQPKAGSQSSPFSPIRFQAP